MKKTFFKIIILGFILTSLSLCFLFFLTPRKIIITRNQPIEKVNNKEINDSSQKKQSLYLEDLTQIRRNFLLGQLNFLEINLSKMKTRVYKMGGLEKEVPILAKGDSQEWGGTAVGLYQIKSKNRLAFSAIAKVYMPYSLHFYGTYYIHGEPYYPGGRPLISEISGGCIRLANSDAKSIYELSEEGMPVLVIDKENDNFKYQSQKTIEKELEVSAESYLVADLDSGFVFGEKKSEEQVPIASLTKLMTALVVSEHIDRRSSILVRPEMLEVLGFTQGLEAGKKFRFVELLYPLLIESSNDVAEVLSYFLGREKTIRLMNEKAKAILMEDTNFIDPSGLNPGDVSTAQDLFYLARYILNNRLPFLKISKGEEVESFGEVRFKIENLRNKNLFFQDPNFIGGKTGCIAASQYVGLFIFRFPLENEVERKIVIILLGSPTSYNLKEDTQKTLSWLKENYFSK